MMKKYRLTATLPVVVNAYVEAKSVSELWTKVENKQAIWFSCKHDKSFSHNEDIYDYEIEESA